MSDTVDKIKKGVAITGLALNVLTNSLDGRTADQIFAENQKREQKESVQRAQETQTETSRQSKTSGS